MAERPTRAQRGIPRAGTLAREAREARAQHEHGKRPDVTLKRDCKHERTGARAGLGNGMADADRRELDTLRAARADGYLVPRSTREERRELHALAHEDWAPMPDANDTTTEGH